MPKGDCNMSVFDERAGQIEKSYEDARLVDTRREIVPNLKQQKRELEARIIAIDELLAILERNPDFPKFFDLARKLV
jgi:hypothetical protein